MTRVRFLAAAFCATMMFALSNVNAQCSSCAQGVAPVFSGYAAPASNYVAAPYYGASAYSQPTNYMPQQVSYAAPVSNGCSSCGTAGYAMPQATYAMAPVSSGCSSCGQGCNQMVQPGCSGCSGCSQAQGTYTSMPAVYNSGCGCSTPAVNYSQPVSTSSAPVNNGCCSACATTVQPQRQARVRILGQRRNNNCSTCN